MERGGGWVQSNMLPNMTRDNCQLLKLGVVSESVLTTTFPSRKTPKATTNP